MHRHLDRTPLCFFTELAERLSLCVDWIISSCRRMSLLSYFSLWNLFFSGCQTLSSHTNWSLFPGQKSQFYPSSCYILSKENRRSEREGVCMTLQSRTLEGRQLQDLLPGSISSPSPYPPFSLPFSTSVSLQMWHHSLEVFLWNEAHFRSIAQSSQRLTLHVNLILFIF